ncbi:hypothetical protein BUALT_Bualt08G0116200 [Buddleja alternifolia]|uniref:J domain-containing protein n=1 Tax=Buddleja alternifolia TaxID=168488 RepID=A0AAV6X600_9LAMI|nr:hypothetical protein BUALT_Bualt08G0116200 [Buddleja alternifolia]
MDEFGVLVESIGFKAHGKSAPIAESKTKPKSDFTTDTSTSTSPFNDSSAFPVDELDGIFQSNVNINQTHESVKSVADDDILVGGAVSSSNSNQYDGIDFESALNRSNVATISSNMNDLLESQSRQSDSVGDLLGSFEVNSGVEEEKKGAEFEDLIPGFGAASLSDEKVHSDTDLPPESIDRLSNPSSTLADDPFLVFESSVSQSDVSWSKGTVQSAIDELDDFAVGGVHNVSSTTDKTSAGTSSNRFENVDDLDTLFSGGMQQKHAAKPSTSTQDSDIDIFFHEEKGTEEKQTSSQSLFSTEKASSASNIGDDFSSLFGDVITSSEEFQEIDGEPEERRRARLSRHMRTNARVAEALAEKNQRDLQSQLEQEEKRRLAETLENDIKRWAAGKEGNLRALLSSLQQVLWTECGWRPVSLTDMITSDSVKKVYKKATLFVHPDKVQQKGADLQQKYIAEKVFDILKEAWNKFSAEELR